MGTRITLLDATRHHCLSPSHRDHNFECIPILEFHGRERAARDDFTVTLQCDAFALQRKMFKQAGHAQRGRKGARLAIDDDCDHFKLLRGLGNINPSMRV
jgi:hypothetical protein